MRYRGYTDPIEVLIDILDELREIKSLLPEKQPQEVEEPKKRPYKRRQEKVIP